MKSIRHNLFLAVWGLLILLVVFCGGMAYQGLKIRLYSEFDKALLHRLSWAVSMVEIDEGQISFDWEEWHHGIVSGVEEVYLWMKHPGDNGKWLMYPQKMVMPKELPDVREQREWRTIPLVGKETARCVGMAIVIERDWDRMGERRVEQSGGGSFTQEPAMAEIWVGMKDSVQPSLDSILRWMVVMGLGGILVGGVGIHFILGKQLQPLASLTHWIGENQKGRAEEALRLSPCPTELHPIVEALNHLVAHNRTVLLREKTLTSNVAHELRNPVAGLMSTLEVLLHRERSQQEYRQAVLECFEIVKRMHWLVNNLLSLARMESGNQRFFPRKIVIEECLQDWWEPFADRAFERGITVEWQIDPKAVVEVDPDFLRLVISNLFDNAVSYCPHYSNIRVCGNAMGRITIMNSCSMVLKESTDRVFDPFWRSTEGRGGDGNHVGLGLSLCRKVMEGMGGKIKAWAEDSGRLFVVEVELMP